MNRSTDEVKTAPPPPVPAPADEAALLVLLHTAREVEARVEKALAEHGLSMAKYGMLDQLARAGEPLTLTELANRLSCVRSNITQLVDRLEVDGLVKRVDDPADRRSIRAVLTPLGRERQAAGARAFGAVQAEIMGGLPAAERAALLQALMGLV